MKRYRVNVNCGCYEEIEVEARNKEEAIGFAENQFQCSADSPQADKDSVQEVRKK